MIKSVEFDDVVLAFLEGRFTSLDDVAVRRLARHYATQKMRAAPQPENDPLSDLIELLLETTEFCHGGDGDDPCYLINGRFVRCLSSPVYKVRWSDRRAFCCEAHLAQIKERAACDNSGDRTDNPRVASYEPSEVALRWWPEIIKTAKRLK